MSDHSIYLLDIGVEVSVYLVPVELADRVEFNIRSGSNDQTIDDYLNGFAEVTDGPSLSRESISEIITKKISELYIINIDKATHETNINLLLPCFEFVFHEQQVEARCGLHSINNILQRAAYKDEDMQKIAMEVQILELGNRDDGYQNLHELVSNYNPYASNPHSRNTGWYSLEVLNMALRKHNLKLHNITSIDLDSIDFNQEVAFLVFRSQNHILALRKFDRIWYNLDSQFNEPKSFDTDELFKSELQSYAFVNGNNVYQVMPHNQNFEIINDKERQLRSMVSLYLNVYSNFPGILNSLGDALKQNDIDKNKIGQLQNEVERLKNEKIKFEKENQDLRRNQMKNAQYDLSFQLQGLSIVVDETFFSSDDLVELIEYMNSMHGIECILFSSTSPVAIIINIDYGIFIIDCDMLSDLEQQKKLKDLLDIERHKYYHIYLIAVNCLSNEIQNTLTDKISNDWAISDSNLATTSVSFVQGKTSLFESIGICTMKAYMSYKLLESNDDTAEALEATIIINKTSSIYLADTEGYLRQSLLMQSIFPSVNLLLANKLLVMSLDFDVILDLLQKYGIDEFYKKLTYRCSDIKEDDNFTLKKRLLIFYQNLNSLKEK